MYSRHGVSFFFLGSKGVEEEDDVRDDEEESEDHEAESEESCPTPEGDLPEVAGFVGLVVPGACGDGHCDGCYAEEGDDCDEEGSDSGEHCVSFVCFWFLPVFPAGNKYYTHIFGTMQHHF